MPITIIDGVQANAQVPLDLKIKVATLTARNSINTNTRYDGMKVYVTAEQKNYQLIGGITNGDWVEVATAQTDTFEHTATAGETISALKVIKLDEAIVSSSSSALAEYRAYVIDATDSTDADRAVGIAKTSAIEGNDFIYVIGGEFTDISWSWDITKPIYVTSVGVLTQTTPTTGYAQIIAIPVSDDTIKIDIKQAIKLV